MCKGIGRRHDDSVIVPESLRNIPNEEPSFSQYLIADRSNTSVDDFFQLYSLKQLLKRPTCYKNPDYLSTIDLKLTNVHRSFQNLVPLKQIT